MKKEGVIWLFKSLLSLIIIAISIYLGLWLMLFIAYSSIGKLLFFCLIAYAIFIWIIICSLWDKNYIKKTHYIPIIIIVILLLPIPISTYDDGVPTLKELSVINLQYKPFYSEGRLATLNEDSTLKLEDDLPKIDCSTDLYPVLSAFVQATYPEASYHPYDNNSVFYQTDTDKAYQRLAKGEVDVILVSPPSKTQLEDFKNQGIELNLTPIGKEAFVFFVNSKNPVDNLTVEQLQNIYSGKITNWKDVSGKNQNIRAFQRIKNSGSQKELLKIMGDIPLMKPPFDFTLEDLVWITTKTSDYKNYTNAIGFSFRYYSTEMVKNNLVKLIKLNGIYPDKETILNGEYPITTEFYAVTIKGKETENTTKFIEWMQSEQGQYIVDKTGYVAINPVSSVKSAN